MLQVLTTLLTNQYTASLRTLEHCVAMCPDALWDARVARYPFSQVAYHTLFFTDYYLGRDLGSFRTQPFHQANPDLFGDYEQLEHREPVCVYTRAQIMAYLAFCRQKVSAQLATETPESLSAPASLFRKSFSFAELHVYTIRHIQHHAAQLILRLRLDSSVDVPWV